MLISLEAVRGSSAKQLLVWWYFDLTQSVTLYLRTCFKISFSDYQAKYAAAFKAGAWESADPGS